MSHILTFKGTTPKVADDAYVADNATLIGDVEIGSESSVWFGAVLRGDILPIRVGARTSVQDNSVLHTSTYLTSTVVGDDVTVGHKVILHGCTVHDRVLVGMGSIVLDGAEIGSDVILGAGSLVTSNTQIPSGVLVKGQPAKVARELREDEIEMLKWSAQNYVERTHEYLEQYR